MGVKNIFKILIGTIVLIIVSCLVVEFMNISMTSTRIQLLGQMAVKQSAVLFGQETYKREDATTVNMNTLTGLDGATVSGTFYTHSDPVDIYDDLYSGYEFSSWMKTQTHNGYKPSETWDNLHAIAVARGWSNGTAEEKALGQQFIDKGTPGSNNWVLMTPLNLGVTYLDKATVQRIARWNATTIFNNGMIEPDIAGNKLINLKTDSTGKPYVSYAGYRVYTNDILITKINYTTYDIMNTSQKADFEAVSGLDADKLLANMGEVGDRRYICVADIEYTLPVAYEGITPIKNIMNFAWNMHVDGYTVDGQTNPYDGYTGIGNTWNDQISTMQGGGLYGNNSLPTSGRITYYVTR